MKKSKKKQLVMSMIFRVANLWQQKSAGMPDGMTLRQFMLLATLRNFPDKKTNLSALSEKFGGTRQNVRQLVNALAGKGFVCMEQSDKDRRETMISLTDKAKTFFDENETAGEDLIQPVFAGVGEKSLDGALECLETMLANLEDDSSRGVADEDE